MQPLELFSCMQNLYKSSCIISRLLCGKNYNPPKIPQATETVEITCAIFSIYDCMLYHIPESLLRILPQDNFWIARLNKLLN